MKKQQRDLNKGHEVENLSRKESCTIPNFPSAKKLEKGKQDLEKKAKNEISFLPYLCGRTLFSSLSGCFSLAFSSWILSFPSCQKETFIHQSNYMKTPVSPLPHYKGRLYIAISGILICTSLAQRCIWTRESIQTSVHPRSSSTCFPFPVNKKLMSHFRDGLLNMSNNLLLLEGTRNFTVTLFYFNSRDWKGRRAE